MLFSLCSWRREGRKRVTLLGVSIFRGLSAMLGWINKGLPLAEIRRSATGRSGTKNVVSHSYARYRYSSTTSALSTLATISTSSAEFISDLDSGITEKISQLYRFNRRNNMAFIAATLPTSSCDMVRFLILYYYLLLPVLLSFINI